MPRGFLVKRNIKSSLVSYRIRNEERQPVEIPPLSGNVRAAIYPFSLSQPSSEKNSPEQLKDGFTRGKIVDTAHRKDELEEDSTSGTFYTKATLSEYSISGWANVSYTPIKPIDKELGNTFFDTCLTPSASDEPFAPAASLNPIERLLVQPHLSEATAKCGGITHLYAPFHGSKRCVPDPGPRKHRSTPKKSKVFRKLNFEDEVSTSPVLGLRIKVDPRDCKPSPALMNKPLGEFICQLCKEQYSDPFSLAQHKCSRIVRVEYRCLECDKVFSCPANLASHRRWHKPRPDPNPQRDNQNCSVEPARAEPVRKENSGERDGSAGTMDSAKQPGCPGGGSVQRMDGRFQCRYCSKRFRRQAYLRKHLGAHEAVGSSVHRHLGAARMPFPCQLCGVDLQTAESRDKHLLWHAVSGGAPALFGPDCGEKCAAPEDQADKGDLGALLFCCKHCPSTFFSSPGLTRHINKCHPSESRQVLLLPLSASAGC
ncbi:insulinoma-associated protein 1b [Pristis pectinata]|uniref:insulinoma-associated protein 1b n=1 Tax=Pristis pectinata TaxID=685728 RepID=UPI00223CB148|nr:insulinoma-associated protein 1b [Pristis pectinata]